MTDWVIKAVRCILPKSPNVKVDYFNSKYTFFITGRDIDMKYFLNMFEYFMCIIFLYLKKNYIFYSCTLRENAINFNKNIKGGELVQFKYTVYSNPESRKLYTQHYHWGRFPFSVL